MIISHFKTCLPIFSYNLEVNEGKEPVKAKTPSTQHEKRIPLSNRMTVMTIHCPLAQYPKV